MKPNAFKRVTLQMMEMIIRLPTISCVLNLVSKKN